MLELVKSYDPILAMECKKFDFRDPQVDISGLGKAMVEFLYEKNALGLAAPQVGYPYQIFAMRGHPENFVFINPRIISHSEEFTTLDEGCLSFPGLIVKVKRYSWVEVRCNHPDGSAKTYKFEGISSHVWQHEYAHLQGRTFFDDASKLSREQAKQKWKKLCRA